MIHDWDSLLMTGMGVVVLLLYSYDTVRWELGEIVEFVTARLPDLSLNITQHNHEILYCK